MGIGSDINNPGGGGAGTPGAAGAAGAAGNMAVNSDLITARVLAELKVFTDWLTANSKKGIISEGGTPNQLNPVNGPADLVLWNAVTEAWFQQIDQFDIWVALPFLNEIFRDHIMAGYSPPRGSTTMVPASEVEGNARVLEAHPTFGGKYRGVGSVSLGESGFPYDSSPGTFGASNAREQAGWVYTVAPDVTQTYSPNLNVWTYGSAATYNFVASRGVKLIRLSFRWERMQRAGTVAAPAFSGALDATELARLKTAIAAIKAAGMVCILDMHNFGVYYLDNGTNGIAQSIGGAVATNAAFANFWSQMATQFAGESAVVGYGLCNEPVGATNWHIAAGPAQTAAAAIRTAGAPNTQAVIVASDLSYSHPQQYAGLTPWITDPNHRYEAHQYFNYTGNQSSTYAQNYAAENVAAFNPANYGTVLGWWKADALGLADGAGIASFTDSSAAGNPLVQATGGLQPIYKTNIVNGKAVARHVATQLVSKAVGQAQPFSLCVVLKVAPTGTDDTFFGTGIPFYKHGTDQQLTMFGAAAMEGGASIANGWTIGCFIVNASASAIFTHNGLGSSAGMAAQTGIPGTTALTALQIGGATFAGDIAEVLLFSTVLTPTQRHSVEQYLSAKYAIPVAVI